MFCKALQVSNKLQRDELCLLIAIHFQSFYCRKKNEDPENLTDTRDYVPKFFWNFHSLFFLQ